MYLCTRKAGPNGGMVDTRDLKSLGHCGRTGSSPVPGTFNNTYELSGNKLVVKSGKTWYTARVHSYKKK